MKLRRFIFSAILPGAIVFSIGLYSEINAFCGWNGIDMESELHAPQPEATKVFWGPETNGLKAGLSIAYYSRKSFKYFSDGNESVPIRCFPLLSYNGTNYENVYSDVLIVDLTTKPCYQLELRDERGKIVQNTAAGKALGERAPLFYKLSTNLMTGSVIDSGHRPLRYYLGYGFDSKLILPFALQEYFVMTNDGKHYLSFRMCVSVPNLKGNGSEEMIWLPKVNCEIEKGVTH